MGVGKDGEGGEGRGNVVCSPGQRIGLAVGSSLSMDDSVGVGREGCNPPGMPPRRNTSNTEVLQIFVVGVDPDRCSSSLRVDPPLLERLHDC